MTASTLLDELAELEGAEEFLDYFSIDYDPARVQVNRLHILQRFHDYLEDAKEVFPQDDAGLRGAYADCMQRAYQDFVDSDALTEKVFKVFRKGDGTPMTFIPLSNIML